MAMTLTGQGTWRLGGAPQAGIVHAHNAYCYRCPFGLTYPDCEVRCAQDMEELIRTTTRGRIAGFIAEPIQGVGGFITPPKEYFQIVAEHRAQSRRHLHQRRSADRLGTHRRQVVRHRAVGRHAGHHHQRQGPRQRHARSASPSPSPRSPTRLKGVTISTFGGNPVTATAAKAVHRFHRRAEPAWTTAPRPAPTCAAELEELKDKHELIGDVRGMGLMQAHRTGARIARPRRRPRPQTAQLMEAARENRTAGRQGRALRQRACASRRR